MPNSNFSKVRRAVIKDLIRLTREKYVYPDIGEKIAAQLQNKFEAGEYDAISDENQFALRLALDLQSLSNDRHWNVAYDPKGAAAHVDPESEADQKRMQRYLEMARKTNYGFERVERLKGNIGYIDLRSFIPSEHAGETAVSAMQFVTHCDALIIDLCKNHGGYPSMVQLITSYLVDAAPRIINTFYYRPTDNTQQFWTFPHVPGRRRPDLPLYVLISHDTGSAAEEFAYNMKHMQRATLVGETTHGAAHPVTKEIIQKDFVVRLPYGRPINPVTGTNWEGTGVEPDIVVPSDQALETAHREAIEHLVAVCKDEDERNDLVWISEIIQGEYSPPVLDKKDLSRCAGEYGKRRFIIKDGSLFYGHQEAPVSWKLVPMTKTRFRLDEDMKFEFNLGDSNRAASVRISYRDGRPEAVAERTD